MPNTSAQEKRKIFDEIIRYGLEKGDFHNATRALLVKASLLLDLNEPIDTRTKARLIETYRILFSERTKYFDACHKVLWETFEREGDIVSLFKMFRYSSLIWRLRGDEEKERAHMNLLAKHAEVAIQTRTYGIERDVAYYMIRTSSSLSG